MSELTDIANNISAIIYDGDFSKDLNKSLSGNKSAAARVRKQTIALDKLFKQYRKVSVHLSNED